MADILFLSSRPAAVDCVRGAVRREGAEGVFHQMVAVGGWAELADAAAARLVCGICIVDPYFGGEFAAAAIRALRERAPATEVIALADFTGRPLTDAFSLAGLGVREMVCVHSRDAVPAVARALGAHLNRGPLDGLVLELRSTVPAAVHRWLAPVMVSTGPCTAAQLARAARCSPRTLRRALCAAGLPRPEQLLAWRRLLHAARLLDDGRSVDCTARLLGFSSGSALRKSCRQLAGLRPGDLRERGGVRWLAGRFLEECGAGSPSGAA